MEQKLVRVPFDVEMAKKITNREVKGNICVIDFPLKIDSFYATDIKSERGKLNVIITKANDSFQCFICDEKGYLYISGDKWNENPLYLEVPEDMAFKDGDLLSCDEGFMFILNAHGIFKTSCYACCSPGSAIEYGGAASMDRIEGYRHATEEERQEFIASLKQSTDERAPKYLKRFFNIETEEHNFKPFDKVLVRQSTSSPWECAFFSNYTDQIHKYRCQGMNYMYCIPYEGNEHLVNAKIGDEKE